MVTAVTVIMLLAGEGSRLRPYTEERPKCLVEIQGKPMLEYQLDLFEEFDIEDIHFVTGYKGQMLHQYEATYHENREYKSSNMVYSLFQAIETIENAESIVIAYGDIIYHSSVLQKLLDSPYKISVVADVEWRSYWEERMENIIDDAESFKTNLDGTVAELGQPIHKIEEVEAQYIGLMKFQGRGVRTLTTHLRNIDFSKETNKKMYLTDFLQDLIKKGNQIYPVYIKRKWFEIDEVSDLKLLEEYKGDVF